MPGPGKVRPDNMRIRASDTFVMPEIVHRAGCGRLDDQPRPCDCDFGVVFPPGTKFGPCGAHLPGPGRTRPEEPAR
jgi:hypothetical protein